MNLNEYEQDARTSRGELLDMAIDKAIPGPTPDLVNPILRQSVNLQVIYTERSIENIQE